MLPGELLTLGWVSEMACEDTAGPARPPGSGLLGPGRMQRGHPLAPCSPGGFGHLEAAFKEASLFTFDEQLGRKCFKKWRDGAFISGGPCSFQCAFHFLSRRFSLHV